MIRSDKGMFWAILLPLIAVLIWSLNIAVTRYVAAYISPVSISFYRWLIAFFDFNTMDIAKSLAAT